MVVVPLGTFAVFVYPWGLCIVFTEVLGCKDERIVLIDVAVVRDSHSVLKLRKPNVKNATGALDNAAIFCLLFAIVVCGTSR